MNKFIGAILLLLIFSTGCHKAAVAPPAITLLNRISNDPDLLILNAAIQRLHLDSAFLDGGPFTFFAPLDSAMVAAGITIDKVNNLDIDSLRALIGYHIVKGRVGTGDILGFLRKRFTSLSQYSPFVSKNYYGIFIDGIHVSEGNFDCSDGVLHKIEGVCLLPPGNLYETVLLRPELSYTAEIVKANPDVAAILKYAPDSTYNGPGGVDVNVTALLPTNGAFEAMGMTLDTVRQWITDGVSARLIYAGILGNEFFTPDLRPNILVNGNLTGVYGFYPMGFGIKDGSDIYLGNDYHGTIIRPNIAATNGVLHVIDSLLTDTKNLIY